MVTSQVHGVGSAGWGGEGVGVNGEGIASAVSSSFHAYEISVGFRPVPRAQRRRSARRPR